MSDRHLAAVVSRGSQSRRRARADATGAVDALRPATGASDARHRGTGSVVAASLVTARMRSRQR